MTRAAHPAAAMTRAAHRAATSTCPAHGTSAVAVRPWRDARTTRAGCAESMSAMTPSRFAVKRALATRVVAACRSTASPMTAAGRAGSTSAGAWRRSSVRRSGRSTAAVAASRSLGSATRPAETVARARGPASARTASSVKAKPLRRLHDAPRGARRPLWRLWRRSLCLR